MNYTLLSQRDSRWANKRLGFSTKTIGGYGCALTCLTMLLNRKYGHQFTPDMVNDRLKTVNAFDGALLWWANIPKAYPELKWVCRDRNYSNAKVAWYVYALRMPVMVEVYANVIGAPKHWVLYIGNRQMVDPWIGSIRPTSTYPAIGDAIFK